MKVTLKNQKQLLSWFSQNKRPLPWRKTKDPYSIWISESMLQQTTSTAVIPYFQRFLNDFPTLKSLALASESQVLQAWAGLGYYSRARNLHKASKELNKAEAFPKTYIELIKLPGFGPYTSRSVSSIAFNEPVGVIDGNVIRVFSRYYSKAFVWWKTQDKKLLQETADNWVQNHKSSEVNQALMELGATICLPKNPKCFICPLNRTCAGLSKDTLSTLPIKKAKAVKQIWTWSAEVRVLKNHIALVKNDYAPFLKKSWLLPGEASKKPKKPTKFDFKHSITKYEIYAHVSLKRASKKTKKYKWVHRDDIKQYIPASLVTKAIMTALD